MQHKTSSKWYVCTHTHTMTPTKLQSSPAVCLQVEHKGGNLLYETLVAAKGSTHVRGNALSVDACSTTDRKAFRLRQHSNCSEMQP